MSQICGKTLLLSSICNKCGSEGEYRSVSVKIKKSFRKYLIMSEENISQEFRLKSKDKTRTYSISK